MSKELVSRVQARAQITKASLQRQLLRLNLNQRLSLTRQAKVRLLDSVAVYADAVELYDFKSLASLKYNLEIKGIIGIKKVSVVFARHGIFLETGAAPKTWTNKKTQVKKSVKHSPRTPKKWLSVVLPTEVEEYRKIVMEEYGAEIAKDLRLVINGVFDSNKPANI